MKFIEVGVYVYWVEIVVDVNVIVFGIVQVKKVCCVIKGKLMVSEEIELNYYFVEYGVDCIEFDMGEFIVQFVGEKLLYIVMLVIYKICGDIVELFVVYLFGMCYMEDVDELIQIGWCVLCCVFVEVDIGLLGVNFVVVDMGMLWFVENEGNGCLLMMVFDMYVVIMGIEKVVEKFEYIVLLLSLFMCLVIGQVIMIYFNLIFGLCCDGECDGLCELYFVLFDNGCMQVYVDE